MKKFFNYFSYVAKHKVAAIAVLIGVAAPLAVFASWSPDRPTFTMENPASYVTFNSITDNPSYGDERPFHDVKDASNTNDGGFENVKEVEDGQTLLLRAYVHNNAAANLNASGEGVAKNTNIKFLVPTGTDKNLRTISYVSADNAQPKTVSDTTDLYADRAFSLDYVEGSARQYTDDTPTSGKVLSDDIVDLNKGATLTSDNAENEGDYLGCGDYVSIVTIKVKVTMPEIDLDKTVRMSGEGSFVDSLDNVQPGDEVQYMLKFTNTGSSVLEDVTIGDNLPPYMTYVQDSAYIYDSNTGAEGRNIGNNIVDGGTILGGSYAANGEGVGRVVFKAVVNESIVDERCGTTTLTNVGIVEAEGSNRVQDEADVKVSTGVDCEEGEEAQYTCDTLTANPDTLKIGETVTFTTDVATTGDVDPVEYRYDFGDGSEVFVTDKAEVEHTYDEADSYRASVDVVFDVDGERETVDSNDCSTIVEVQPESPEETPETPEEAPDRITSTGPAAAFMAITGTSAVGQAISSYVKSRRGLSDVLKG